MFDEVLSALIDRIPERTPAVAVGWRVIALPDRVYPGLVQAAPEHKAAGILIHGLTPSEWTLLDAFEDDAYQLKQLNLQEGETGWAYVCEAPVVPAGIGWNVERFQINALPSYTNQCRSWRTTYQAQVAAMKSETSASVHRR